VVAAGSKVEDNGESKLCISCQIIPLRYAVYQHISTTHLNKEADADADVGFPNEVCTLEGKPETLGRVTQMPFFLKQTIIFGEIALSLRIGKQADIGG